VRRRDSPFLGDTVREMEAAVGHHGAAEGIRD